MVSQGLKEALIRGGIQGLKGALIREGITKIKI